MKNTSLTQELIQTLIQNGVIVEQCGSWLWFSGNTKPNKDILKNSGCWWHNKKQMWYWKPEDQHRRFSSKRNISMDEIREKYGSASL